MMLTLLPMMATTASAAAATVVIVNGVDIADGTALPCGSGTARYDNNALTLTDATINVSDGTSYAGIFANGDLTIHIVGVNTVVGSQKGIHISGAAHIAGIGSTSFGVHASGGNIAIDSAATVTAITRQTVGAGTAAMNSAPQAGAPGVLYSQNTVGGSEHLGSYVVCAPAGDTVTAKPILDGWVSTRPADADEGWTWANDTLTFTKNAVIVAPDTERIAVYLPSGTIKINANGKNAFALSGRDINSYGISGGTSANPCNVEFGGSGSFTVVRSDSTGIPNSGGSGISIIGTVMISDTIHLTGVACKAPNSAYGISADQIAISGGIVTALGNHAGDFSVGLAGRNGVRISGGKITAISSAASSSYALNSSSGDVTISGGETKAVSDGGSANSYGIRANGTGKIIAISGGKGTVSTTQTTTATKKAMNAAPTFTAPAAVTAGAWDAASITWASADPDPTPTPTPQVGSNNYTNIYASSFGQSSAVAYVPASTPEPTTMPQQIDKAAAGASFVVDMSKLGVTLNREILQAAKGKNVDLVYDYGNCTIAVNGKTIGDVGEREYTLTVSAINNGTLKKLANDVDVLQLDVRFSGSVLPFLGRLTYPVDSKYNGTILHVYSYNKDDTLKYVCSTQVVNSTVSFNLPKISKYVLTTERIDKVKSEE